ncbi:MAG TPA: TolC family outer membrane protein, partial [Burkholderiales bacterium]|nr:TolC family outer membrane protein [Burkholderiales bacterium]
MACSAALASAETLPEVIVRAVAYFPDVHSAVSRREAADAQTGQARADLLPSINASLGRGRETSRNPSTRALLSDPTLSRTEADIVFTQLLYDGGASTGQVQRFAARTQGAGYTIANTAEDIGLRAGQAFIDVRRLREQLATAHDNVKVHEQTLADVRALADGGRGRRADVVQAQARLALALSTVELLSGQLRQADAAFRYFTGTNPGNLEEPASLGSQLPARFEEAVDQAVPAHPAVQAAQKDIDAARYDRDSAKARVVAPRVTLEAGASHNRDLDGLVGLNEDRYAMIRLRYKLFRGFGDTERVREAQARIDDALANIERIRSEVVRDARQAWDVLNADRARLVQLRNYWQASADVVEAYRMQFQLGQRSLLDVLNA